MSQPIRHAECDVFGHLTDRQRSTGGIQWFGQRGQCPRTHSQAVMKALLSQYTIFYQELNLCNLGMLKTRINTLAVLKSSGLDCKWWSHSHLHSSWSSLSMRSAMKGLFLLVMLFSSKTNYERTTQINRQILLMNNYERFSGFSDGVRVPLGTQQSRSGLMVDLRLCSWMSLHWAETHLLNFDLLFWKP